MKHYNDVWDEKMAERLEHVWSKSPFHTKLMEVVAEHIEGKEVVDVGCGLGHLFEFLDPKYQYLGLDQSKAMLKRAEKLHPAAAFIEYNLYDRQPIDIFDTVVCLDVLIHQKKLDRALKVLLDMSRKCLLITLLITEDKDTYHKVGVHNQDNLYCSWGDIDKALTGYRWDIILEKYEKVLIKIWMD